MLRPAAPSRELQNDRPSQPISLAMGMRSTGPVSSSRIPWRKDRRMLAYRNVEAHHLKEASAGAAESSSNDELTRFIRESRANLSLLQASDTTAYLASELGKALYELIMREGDEPNLDAPLATVGLDSLVSLELKGWIRRWLGVEVATLEILNCVNMRALGAIVQVKLLEKYRE